MNTIAVLAGLTILAACAPSGAQHDAALADAPRHVDDARAGESLERIAYNGPWEHLTAQPDGRYNATSSRSRHPGSSIVFPFNGSIVRIFGVRGPNGGQAAVGIDGGFYGTADFYAPQKRVHALVFESPALADGTHTLGLVVKAPIAGPHRAYVNIDEIEVLPRQ